jgi:putative GTP pyrophosphokinase
MGEGNQEWLDEALAKHTRLVGVMPALLQNLLTDSNIDFLSVTGRAKDKKSTEDKIKRKGYKNPREQITDLSGFRVIVYLETDLKKVSELVRNSFDIDEDNSLDKEVILKKDQVGYRSVHFVCTLGNDRGSLPEYKGLGILKFEIQIRTVLQHAWAELAHDGNYKFSKGLPNSLERSLYLYAGMLELADRGFDDLATKIEEYKIKVKNDADTGQFEEAINSLSLVSFVENWAQKNGIKLSQTYVQDFDLLLSELKQFGIENLRSLKDLIPQKYESYLLESSDEITILGVVRDWMLIKDWNKYKRDVHFSWVLSYNEDALIKHYISDEDYRYFLQAFSE